jgi:hypothetical protein
VATLGMIPIADRQSEFDSGVAFLCAQKNAVSEVVCLDSGAEVEIQSGCPYVVARIRGGMNPTEVFARAHKAAQEGLDHLAINGKAILSIRNASDEYMVWWRNGLQQILRVVAINAMSFKVEVSDKMTDKDGNPVPDPPPPRLIYSEGFRYFRLAQVTEDLFDAFRNMYLAFELLLEDVCPRNSGGEKEGVWLRRALREVDQRVPLCQVYRTTANVVDDIFADLYTNIRCRLFHAKHGSRLVPQDMTDRLVVSDGLDRLTKLFLLLARELLNARPGGGGLTYEGFAWMTQPLMSNSLILISDNAVPLDASVTLKCSPFAGGTPMVTRAPPELSAPGLQVLLGTIAVDELRHFKRVGTLGWAHDDHLLMSHTIETNLTYEGIDSVEAQMGVRLRNANKPKELFKS